MLDTNSVSDRLEGSYRDFARRASRVLAEDAGVGSQGKLPLERCYRLLGSRPDLVEPKVRLLEGLALATGEARRELPPITVADADMKKVRSLSNFVLLAEKLDNNVDQMLAQLGPMLDSVPEEQGAAAALDVAEHFVRKGQWLLAREAYLLLVQKYPTLPQSAQAFRWLIHHASSSEARRRHELGRVHAANERAFRSEESRPTRSAQARLAHHPGQLPGQPERGPALVSRQPGVCHASVRFRADVRSRPDRAVCRPVLAPAVRGN